MLLGLSMDRRTGFLVYLGTSFYRNNLDFYRKDSSLFRGLGSLTEKGVLFGSLGFGCVGWLGLCPDSYHGSIQRLYLWQKDYWQLVFYGFVRERFRFEPREVFVRPKGENRSRATKSRAGSRDIGFCGQHFWMNLAQICSKIKSAGLIWSESE